MLGNKPDAVIAVHHEAIRLPQMNDLAGNFHSLESARLGVEQEKFRRRLSGGGEQIRRRRLVHCEVSAVNPNLAYPHLVRHVIPRGKKTSAHPDQGILITLEVLRPKAGDT